MSKYVDARRERLAGLHDFARQVAEHLEGWSYEEAESDDLYWRAHLKGPKGAKISLGASDHPPTGFGRIDIAGVLPRGKRGYVPTKSPKSITCAAKRGPEVVAREIARRFLPKYLSAYAEAVAFVERQERMHAETLARAERLGAICGDRPRERDGGYELLAYWDTAEDSLCDRIHIECSTSGDIKVEISGLDEETAARILKLAMGRKI